MGVVPMQWSSNALE